MQVSNVQDHCTHAVIGGKPTIEFGISSSAEFFNILSSTLYSDQILAVVREVLCNAWDAHIAAGCADKPVEVELTNDLFRVRDFGNGIPHESIGEIYGTYGNSTKSNDGKQTGGFGLGCKAPFAYTDHFEVTSTNGGVRTIYTMSKSSAQALGKPGITPITSFPSTDSGLQVSLAIKSEDRIKFRQYIEYLAYMGDMNISFNGVKQDKLGMTDDFAIVYFHQNPTKCLCTQSHILIRYGNVVYPLPSDAAWSGLDTNIIRQLSNFNPQSFQLILQAPPHSIAVTPSRESLSLQEHTITTVNGLLTEFQARLMEVRGARSTKLKEFLDLAVRQGQTEHLLELDPTYRWVQSPTYKTIKTTDELTTKAVKYQYPGDLKKLDIINRVEALAKLGVYDPGLSLSFLKALNGTINMDMDMAKWTWQRLFMPLINGLDAEASGVLTGKNLYVFFNSDLYWRDKKASPLKDWTDSSAPYVKALLKKIVVVSNAVGTTLGNRLARCPDFQGDKLQQCLVYHTGRGNAQIKPAVEFFLKRGYQVLDMTQEQPWDIPKVTRVASRKEKVNSWFPLSYIKDGSYSVYVGRAHDTDRYSSKDRICKNPDFYVDATSSNSNRFHSINNQAARKIVDLFGDTACVVKFKYEIDPLVKLGIPESKEWLIDYMLDYVKNNPQIIDYFQYCPKKLREFPSNTNTYFNLVTETEDLAKKCGITAKALSEKEMDHYSILLGMLNSSVFASEPEFAAIIAKYDSTKLAQEYIDLSKKVNNNVLLNCIDAYAARRILTSKSSPTRPALVELIFNIINT